MKATELRIDNLVYRRFKVVRVRHETLNNLQIHPLIIGRLYQPIKITEEWLLSFGFEKREQGVCNYFHIGTNPVTHDWLFDLVWLKECRNTDKYEGFPFYKNGRFVIKYVHQLQNLFFALTQEELKLPQL